MLVLSIISLDFFSLLLYIIIFKINNVKFPIFMIAPVIASTAMILIFHFAWNLSPVITINISSVLLSANIYMAIISIIYKNIFGTYDSLIGIAFFNLAKFMPLSALFLIGEIIKALLL